MSYKVVYEDGSLVAQRLDAREYALKRAFEAALLLTVPLKDWQIIVEYEDVYLLENDKCIGHWLVEKES